MKQTLIFFAMIVFASSFTPPAKSIGEVSKNTTTGYRIATDGMLIAGTVGEIDLENLIASYQTGKGKTTTPVISISGLRSSLRLSTPTGVILKFLTHFESGPTYPTGYAPNPNNDIMLYKFNVDKKNRTSASPIQILFTSVEVFINL